MKVAMDWGQSRRAAYVPTGEDDEVGVLVAEDAVEEGGGVEVGAPGHLGREHVLAARGRGQRVQYSAPFAVHMS